MNAFRVPATKSSPEIDFDPEQNIFRITGESYPENCWAFYKPMFKWLDDYFAKVKPGRMEFELEILYFNSSSSKTFMDFFDLLEEQADEGSDIVVRWRYHEENETAMECGEEFMEDVSSIDFKLVEFSD